MEPNESIIDIFTRFTYTINGLKRLVKSYTNSDLVQAQKILRSLLRAWKAKFTTIQEAKNLNSLPLKELLSSLMTHELTMKKKYKLQRKKDYCSQVKYK